MAKTNLKIPIYKLAKDQRLWLSALIALLRENKRYDFRSLFSSLRGKIADNFQPKLMNHHLVSADGEQIRLLGIVAVDRNLKFLKLCNVVIGTIREIVLDSKDPTYFLETVDIAKKSNTPVFETGVALFVIYEYGCFYRNVRYDENGFNVSAFEITSEQVIYHQYRNFTSIEDLITERLVQEDHDQKWLSAQAPGSKVTTLRQSNQFSFVSEERIGQLRKLPNISFDFSKLIRLAEELNSSYAVNSYYSTAMLLRAILDHVPPLFKMNNFDEVANSYGGLSGHKSFKQVMKHLNESLKSIANHHLHSQIRAKEVLPTQVQVNFSQDLDVLLGEIIRIAK